MSRKSIADCRDVGRSFLVPFMNGENANDRHERRLNSNLKWQDELAQWATENGYSFKVSNGGHHWILTKGKTRVEWWPSSAKVIFNQQWRKGIHCHDYKQLCQLMISRENRMVC